MRFGLHWQKSKFYLLHIADRADNAEWSSFPAVRSLLARWGLIEETAPKSAVAEKLGVKIAKVQLEPREPKRAIEEFVLGHPSELIALGTLGRVGITRWLHGSLAEALSRHTRIMTLFVGSSLRSFVDPNTGAIMPTAGHHGFLDAMRGSTSERILRHAPCPVHAIPV